MNYFQDVILSIFLKNDRIFYIILYNDLGDILTSGECFCNEREGPTNVPVPISAHATILLDYHTVPY